MPYITARGDSVRVAEIKSIDYQRKSSSRLKKVLEYVDSDDFEVHIAIAFIGSIPKFHLVRCVEMSRGDNPVTDCRITHGLKRYQQDSGEILQGGNKTVGVS